MQGFNYCMNCGSKLDINDKFCSNCGVKVGESDSFELIHDKDFFLKYKIRIENLNKEYDIKVAKALELIKKEFEPSEMSYNNFISTINNSNNIFYNNVEVALNIIDLASKPSNRIKNELDVKIDTLNSIISKFEDFIDELIIHIADKSQKEVRIPARDSKGRLLAWLVPVGVKRLNSTRAYSELGAIMQKLYKIGQYSNSEVIAAETNAKFAAWVEQTNDSSGVNPIKAIPGVGRQIQSLIGESGADSTTAESAAEASSFKKALKKIASGLFIHMPKGQKLNSFDTKRPNINHAAFVDGAMKYNYASSGVPFEVALMQFSNNFSASRASLKMFEFILEVRRKDSVVDNFYQIVYEQFFELECLKNNIQAPKYLELKNDKGYLDNAYTKAKFVGNKIPHIDEVKEVNAVLSKIKGGLSTFEQALETLGISTDFDSLIERRKLEEEKIREAGLTFETMFAPDGGPSQDEDTEADVKTSKTR